MAVSILRELCPVKRSPLTQLNPKTAPVHYISWDPCKHPALIFEAYDLIYGDALKGEMNVKFGTRPKMT